MIGEMLKWWKVKGDITRIVNTMPRQTRPEDEPSRRIVCILPLKIHHQSCLSRTCRAGSKKNTPKEPKQAPSPSLPRQQPVPPQPNLAHIFHIAASTHHNPRTHGWRSWFSTRYYVLGRGVRELTPEQVSLVSLAAPMRQR